MAQPLVTIKTVVHITPTSVPIPLGLSIGGLGGGNYTITYKDARGCTITASHEIINPPVCGGCAIAAAIRRSALMY
jgi:hypothetical protein